jgi:hypothetical protein
VVREEVDLWRSGRYEIDHYRVTLPSEATRFWGKRVKFRWGVQNENAIFGVNKERYRRVMVLLCVGCVGRSKWV